jgi:uncharacterized membrane protein
MAAKDPPDETPLTRGDLDRLHRGGVVGDESYRAALALWDGSRAWLFFAARWLTVLGAVSLLAGILFFFAWNWKDLHRFTRFAILEGGVLLAAIGAAWMLRPLSPSSEGNPRRLPGEMLLVAAAVLTGILIAVYGQVYQTGADAFQNFLGWAALILPWVLVGRSALLWVLWFAVLKTGMIFFWTQVMGPTGAAGFGILFLLLGLVVMAATLAREILAQRPAFSWLAHRALRYLCTSATLTWLGISTVRLIFYGDFEGATAVDAIGALLFTAAAAVAFWWFCIRDYDLGALLIIALFSATLALIALGRLLLEGSDSGDPGVWIVMAFCTLATYGGAGFALQQIYRAREKAPSA